jgi:hypothetical protein
VHLFVPHAMLLRLEDRENALLSSLSVLDSRLGENDDSNGEELRVRRMQRWRGEALGQPRFTRLQVELVCQQMEYGVQTRSRWRRL